LSVLSGHCDSVSPKALWKASFRRFIANS
jgi:hypothetical protein